MDARPGSAGPSDFCDNHFANPFDLCIIRAPLDGLHFGAAFWRDELESTLHTVLTDSKAAVRCAARFNEKAFGPNAEAGRTLLLTEC